MEVHAGPSQYDDGDDEEEEREVGALGFGDCDAGGNQGDHCHGDDSLSIKMMVLRRRRWWFVAALPRRSWSSTTPCTDWSNKNSQEINILSKTIF